MCVFENRSSAKLVHITFIVSKMGSQPNGVTRTPTLR